MGRIDRIVDIEAPVERCYRLWSHFQNFPAFMDDVEEVCQTGPDIYHWIARTSHGQEYEWDSRVLVRQENRLISWESLSGIGHSGTVRFEPCGDGCRVHVSLELNLPGGEVEETFAKVTRERGLRVEHALRKFKQLCEGAAHLAKRRPAANDRRRNR